LEIYYISKNKGIRQIVKIAPNAVGFLTIKDAVCFLRLASFGAIFTIPNIDKNRLKDKIISLIH
tara:strand:- start:223 stop:414 length:192 start_codon:yes stop_codon:yes gene_type:complete